MQIAPPDFDRMFGALADHTRRDIVRRAMEVDPPGSLVASDGFANDDGSPSIDVPMSQFRVTIEEIGAGRTRMSIISTFPSIEAMKQLMAFGMEAGLMQAVGQIDAILAETAAAQTAAPRS
jgi:uncharacterized protein YndB with AHSA1/START domain